MGENMWGQLTGRQCEWVHASKEWSSQVSERLAERAETRRKDPRFGDSNDY